MDIFLHFAKTEDIWLKSALKAKRGVLLNSGGSPLFSQILPITLSLPNNRPSHGIAFYSLQTCSCLWGSALAYFSLALGIIS
jgi:hypothetical protein